MSAEHVEQKTPAQISLDMLNAAITAAGPEFEIEVGYVEERLKYLIARHGIIAEYAIMRSNFKTAIEKGQ